MRGKADGAGGRAALGRITPAYAGKSRFPSSKAPSRRDHPRVCGEKPAIRFRPPGGLGITPACAGKSYFDLSLTEYKEDHPRVCGEKFITLFQLFS